MSTCENCGFFFPISKDADDYEAGKGDCVRSKKDEKGKYWVSTPTFGASETCPEFNKKL
ncbi:MAG: benzylsuccinate synthase gamma subunit family protein [Pseudomonadota bacterium]